MGYNWMGEVLGVGFWVVCENVGLNSQVARRYKRGYYWEKDIGR